MPSIRQLLVPAVLLVLLYFSLSLYTLSSLESSVNSSSSALSPSSPLSPPPTYHDLLRASEPHPPLDSSKGKLLGVFDKIKIIHLEHRTDRLERMSKLLDALGLANDDRVEFVSATPSQGDRVGRALEQVAAVRKERLKALRAASLPAGKSGRKKGSMISGAGPGTSTPQGSSGHSRQSKASEKLESSPLSKRSAVDVLVNRLSPPFDPSLFLSSTLQYQASPLSAPLGREGSDEWFLPSSGAAIQSSSRPTVKLLTSDPHFPLANYPPSKLPKNESSSPHRYLGYGMVACFDSHLRVLRDIVEEGQETDEDGVVLILEDDVDAEFDLEARLRGMWGALPASGWDVLL